MRDVVGMDAPRNSATIDSFAAGCVRRYAITLNCGTESPAERWLRMCFRTTRMSGGSASSISPAHASAEAWELVVSGNSCTGEMLGPGESADKYENLSLCCHGYVTDSAQCCTVLPARACRHSG